MCSAESVTRSITNDNTSNKNLLLINIYVNYIANAAGIAFNDAFYFFKQRADTNAHKLRGFTAVSFGSSYVFNINKTNASPLLSYMVRGVEQMLQKEKKIVTAS